MAIQGFDYDVIVIGSGFGGSVAAMRATEKGYRVGVMEAGKRWRDEDIPKTSWDIRKFAWQPEAEMYGIQRMEFLDDVLVLCGAGVGGGSHVYGNTLYVPPKKFFDAPEWAGITDWADEVAPYIDQASRMLGVVRVPYMDTQVDRLMREVARDMGKGNSYNRAPVGVYFGSPDVEADDPYFGGAGPKRRGCINCGNCMIGCGRNSKNKLTVNYLYLAEKFGAKIHELQEVHDLKPLDGGGFEVHARHPGWAQRAADLHHHTYTAEQVIVSAHAYGSAKLLHRLKHTGTLSGLSGQLGQRARTNSEQLLSIMRPFGNWKHDPEKIHITPGSVAITSGVWPDPQTSIEPVYYGVGSNVMAFLMTYHQHAAQKHPVEGWLKELIEHPSNVLGHMDARQINTLGIQVGSEKTGFAILRLGGALLRSGVGLFALSLTTGLGLILHYFYVTPFEPMCSASFATMAVTEAWPWALPLLATEGFALAVAALGFGLISQARHGREVGRAHS